MSDLAPRPRGGAPRRAREQRAYRLVLAGAAAATVAVVGLVLAVIGAVGIGFPLLAGVVAVICWMLFRRTLSA